MNGPRKTLTRGDRITVKRSAPAAEVRPRIHADLEEAMVLHTNAMGPPVVLELPDDELAAITLALEEFLGHRPHEGAASPAVRRCAQSALDAVDRVLGEQLKAVK